MGSNMQRTAPAGLAPVGYGESSGTGHPNCDSSVRAATGPGTTLGDSLTSRGGMLSDDPCLIASTGYLKDASEQNLSKNL